MKVKILFPDKLGIYRSERFFLLNDLIFIARGRLSRVIKKMVAK